MAGVNSFSCLSNRFQVTLVYIELKPNNRSFIKYAMILMHHLKGAIILQIHISFYIYKIRYRSGNNVHWTNIIFFWIIRIFFCKMKWFKIAEIKKWFYLHYFLQIPFCSSTLIRLDKPYFWYSGCTWREAWPLWYCSR